MKQDAGSNILTVRENNLALIIRLMHRAGVCTRAQLSESTGLKQATITYIINDLTEWGLVEETGAVEGKHGRRSKGIRLRCGCFRIIGVRIRRDRILLGVFDITGSLLEQETIQTAGLSAEQALGRLAERLNGLIARDPELTFLGVGLVVPGPFNTHTGRVEMISNMPTWSNVNIAETLKNAGVPIPIFAEHDAKCGALGEVWYGDVGDHRDILVITAENAAVGAGIIVDGQLYGGRLGMAGEIGHMSIDYTGELCECGNRGCLETYCSAARIRTLYRQELVASGSPEDAAHMHDSIEQILAAVAAGDPNARRAFRKVAVYLGLGLVNLVNILNPSLIVLSGWLAEAGSYLVDVLSETLRRHLVPALYETLTVRLSNPTGDMQLFGASALVMEHILEQPTLYFRPSELPGEEEAEDEE